MTEAFHSEQEQFWAGEFGDAYIDRNPSDKEAGARLALFARIFGNTRAVRSTIEFGANIGNNLKSIRQLFPRMELAGVEINRKAAELLSQWGGAAVFQQSILDFSPGRSFDLAFVSGVLIHINPALLPEVYHCLYQAAARYIAVIEYYNPTPVEVGYRGHRGRLFKRDFAGEMLDRYPDLSLVDYGFVYHRDPNYPLDDLSWFLLEKR